MLLFGEFDGACRLYGAFDGAVMKTHKIMAYLRTFLLQWYKKVSNFKIYPFELQRHSCIIKL